MLFVPLQSKSRLTGEIFAIKEIRIDQNEGISATTMNEIAIIKELRHPNIVKLHDVQVNETKISLVFEYCDHDLWKYMQGNGLLDPSIVRTFMKQLLLGISDCHASGFHHRDLKPQNLLIDNNRALKIADFGMAKTYDLPIDKHSKDVCSIPRTNIKFYYRLTCTKAVTLWYRAPELLLGSTSYTTSVDIWSIGCIFAEMLCGKAFFQGRDDQTQLNKIMLAMGTPSAAQYRNMKCGYVSHVLQRRTAGSNIPLL
jgi:serine/threonine protein kinase